MNTVFKIHLCSNASFTRNFFNCLRSFFWTKKAANFGKYKIVEPGNVSPQKTVPDHIKTPIYYKTGIPEPGPLVPEVKSPEQILKMRESCKLAANILKAAGDSLRAGQTTDELDTYVHDLIIANNAYPSPLNYKFYPKSVCTSVNNVACHGIPDDRPLEDGDIINVDITVYYDGYHGDCSKTFLVGDVDEVGQNLVQATESCLYAAIACCKPDQYFWQIGLTIETLANNLGYNVIPAFAGHGIGEYFHGAPDIFHTKNYYSGKMAPGMTFTIEPVLTLGSVQVEVLEDEWTAVTTDYSRTAQAEHTILITNDGVEILTLPDLPE